MSDNENTEQERLEILVNWFKEMAENKEGNKYPTAFECHLGFHIANRVLFIYKTNQKNLSELKLLVKVLKLGIENSGSCWFDLLLHARHLLTNLSEESK